MIPKSNDSENTNNCIDLPPLTNPLGYAIQKPETTYVAPCFNPLNKNEIVYIRQLFSANINELVISNLSTKSETVLVRGGIKWHPNFGSNGWILFNHGDNRVWKIKTNGDSLTRLTSKEGFDAVWNPTGTKFIYRISDSIAPHIYYTFIANPDGTVIDIFYDQSNMVYKGTWSPDGTKIATAFPLYPNASLQIRYIDLATKQSQSVYEYNGTTINSIDWMPDSQTLIWTADQGIFKTNINTGQTIQIKKGCISRTYMWLSVSNDGSKIIVERIDKKAIGESIIWEENHLFTMDPYGRNETKLELP